MCHSKRGFSGKVNVFAGANAKTKANIREADYRIREFFSDSIC